MTFKIEKKVTIPRSQNHTEIVFPFKDLDVGDSFLVLSAVRSLSNLKKRIAKLNALGKAHYVCRAEKGGTRIWRTA